MSQEPNKPRPVQMTSRGYKHDDRTDDLRIQKGAAQRLIARYLRERMSPSEANDLADRICDGILCAMPTPSRPALLGWRMISEHAPHESIGEIAGAFRRLSREGDDGWLVREIWATVYKHGTSLPDDVVV
jgi:hypothetical protein